MAPESWNESKYDEKVDVYAFSLILYELFTGILPYEKLDKGQICYKVAVRKERPEFNDLVPDYFKDLIERCWSDDPSQRPSFESIANELRNYQNFEFEGFDKKAFQTYIDYIENGIPPTILSDTYEEESWLETYGSSCDEEAENIKNIKNELQSLNIPEIDLSKFEKLNILGSGGYAQVYLIVDIETKQKYAAKELIKGNSDDFLHELKILHELKHPLIISFIGYSLVDFQHEPSMIIVTEYVPNGSLRRIIQDEHYGEIDILSETLRLINIYGIASAILHMHLHNVLHLDINPNNILVNDFLIFKICDLGISRKTDNDQLMMPGIIGTFPFISPEILENKTPTNKSDVFSFGMLVYTIMYKCFPYEGRNPANIMFLITSGNRPELKDTIPNAYRKLINECWDSDPNKRPTIGKIVDDLRKNREFITSGIDKNLYRSFIKIIDDGFNGVDSIEKLNQLCAKYKVDIINYIEMLMDKRNTSC